jgi:alpha-1,2-mannosyltransferase
VRFRRPATIAAWLLAAGVAALQAYAALSRPVADRLSDLHVYVGAADLLRQGGSLYDFSARGGAPFTYPPFAGLLFLPLSLIDEAVLRWLWTVVTVAAVCWLAALTARRAGLLAGLPAALGTGLAALCLFLSAPVSSDIRFGQVSVFLAVLIVWDLCFPHRARGVLTGITAAVKLTPLIFAPFLFLAGRKRAAVATVLAFVACGLLAWALLPGETARYWLTEVWDVNRVGHISTGGNQSLNGALLRLGVPGGVRTLVMGLGGLAVTVLALWRGVRATRAGQWFVAVVVVGAASVVVSPVSWTHHQVWLVLAAFLPIAARARISLMWTVGALLIMVLPVTSLGPVAGELRLLLAIAVACVLPFDLAGRPAVQPPPARARSRQAYALPSR